MTRKTYQTGYSRRLRKTYRRPIAVRTRADHECSECFGYPFHEPWCKKVKDN